MLQITKQSKEVRLYQVIQIAYSYCQLCYIEYVFFENAASTVNDSDSS